MIHVKQFRYSSDNLAYVLHGKKEAMAVDGGATALARTLLLEQSF